MIDKLIQEIENDLDWREAELAALKVQTAKSEKGSTKYRALLRSLTALLYAHYEGYTKFVWDIYLDHLEKVSPNVSDCIDNLACFSFSSKFKSIKKQYKHDDIYEFCKRDFNRAINSGLKFDEQLSTNSNLWPDLFIENCEKVGLPSKEASDNIPRLKALVTRRNDIAHGQKMYIKEISDYQDYEDAVYLVMHELAISVVESFEMKSYLK